jgi:hypothetical protein
MRVRWMVIHPSNDRRSLHLWTVDGLGEHDWQCRYAFKLPQHNMV